MVYVSPYPHFFDFGIGGLVYNVSIMVKWTLIFRLSYETKVFGYYLYFLLVRVRKILFKEQELKYIISIFSWILYFGIRGRLIYSQKF